MPSSPFKPEWKKPKDTLKKFRRCRTKSKKSTNTIIPANQSTLSSFITKKNNTNSGFNLFKKAKTNDKKSIFQNSEETSKSIKSDDLKHVYDKSIFNSLSQPDFIDETTRSASHFNPFLDEDSINNVLYNLKPTNKTVEPVFHSNLPTDWSIKIKARFCSLASFHWCQKLDEEYDEAISHISGKMPSEQTISSSPHDLFSNELSEPMNNRVKLASKLVYYEFPIIEGRSLFPRHACDVTQRSGWTYKPNTGTKLHYYEWWQKSFMSAYKSFVKKRLPFFYVCSQDYTALWRNSENEQECLVTPVSEGFKKLLMNEGAEIMNPNDVNLTPEELVSNSEPLPKLNTESDEDEIEVDQEEDAELWNSIICEVSRDRSDTMFQDSRSNSNSHNKSKLVKSSTVLVRGKKNLRLLHSFLLNSKCSITVAGPQQHLPPTILSPLPFQGGSIQFLRVKTGAIKVGAKEDDTLIRMSQSSQSQRQFTSQQQWGLDVSGPILPNHLQAIIEIFNETQKGYYSLAMSAYKYMGSFNNVKLTEHRGDISKCTKLHRKIEVQDSMYHYTS